MAVQVTKVQTEINELRNSISRQDGVIEGKLKMVGTKAGASDDMMMRNGKNDNLNYFLMSRPGQRQSSEFPRAIIGNRHLCVEHFSLFPTSYVLPQPVMWGKSCSLSSN